jgi:hypothetical protein
VRSRVGKSVSGLGGKNLDRLAALKAEIARKSQSEASAAAPTEDGSDEVRSSLPRIQTKIERGGMPERVMYRDQNYQRDPHRGSLYFRDDTGLTTDVFKYEYERSATLPPEKAVPVFIYVTYGGEIILERGKTANPEQTNFKKIKDPTLPVVGEIRVDDEGKKWRYESMCSATEFFSHSGFDITGPGWDSRWGINDYSEEMKRFYFGNVINFTQKQLAEPRSIPKDIPYFSWEFVRDQE